MRKFINLIAFAALLFAPALAKAQCNDGELQCAVTIECHDSYGDGWNGNAINVFQGDVLRGSATVTSGHDATVEIAVCGSDDSLRFEWVSGNYSSECSYTIYNGDGTELHSGSGALATFSAAPVCPTCIKVTNLAFTDIDNQGFTATWAGNETGSQWLVYLDGELTSDSPVSDSTYTFSGLEPNTQYSVSIRTYCTEGDTSVAVSGSARTLCQNGNCQVTVAATGTYGYNPSVQIYQNNSLLATVSGQQDVDICNGDSVVFIYQEPSYDFAPTVRITDAGGSDLFNGTTSSLANGDTIVVVANGCPSCIPPSVSVDSIGSHTATLTWTDASGDGNSEYIVYVEGQEVASVAGELSYELTGLSASTTITAGVAKICYDDGGEPDTSAMRTVEFRTGCGSVSLPYHEDFSGLGFDASNGLPVPCWIAHYTCTTGGRTFPCGSADGDNPTMAFTADPGMTIFIATDTIPVSGDSLFVSFRAQPNGNVDFWCGVMSDPYDSTTFIPIGSGIHTTNATNQWGEYLFSTVGFSPDTAYRVAFKYRGTGYTGNWVNVDDIEIRVFDGCIRPTELTATQVTTTEATLDWMQNGTESSWLLTVDGAEPVEISEKPYTLVGLEANKVYSVSLSALCASGDTTEATTTTFRTACTGDTCVVNVVSYADYELIQNGSTFGMVSGTNTFEVCSGTPLQLHSTNGYGYDITVSNAAGIELFSGLSTDAVDTLDLGQPCPSCMPAIDLTTADITAEGCTFSWTPMNGGNVANWIVLVDGVALDNSVADTFVTITGLTPNTDHTLAVRANCGNGDSSLIRSTTVHTLCADGNCQFTVQVTGSYSYYCGSVNVWQDGNLTANIDVDGNGAMSLCLGSPITLTFQAPSYTFVSYTYGFTISKDDSVLLSVADASGYAQGDTILVFDGQCNATAYDVPDPIVEPQPGDCAMPTGLSATATETTATVTFSGYADSYEVEIVAGSWQGSMGNAEPIITTTHTFTDLQPGTAYSIAVRSVCVDDYDGDTTYSDWATTAVTTQTVVVEGCDVPTDLEVVDGTVDTTSVVLHWTDHSNASRWQIKLTSSAGTDTLTVTGTTYSLNGLTPATSYYAQVRALCSDTLFSGWSETIIFQTASHGTGIDAIDAISVRLFPNPASSVVTIEVAEPAEVSMVDISGRTVGSWTTDGSALKVALGQMAKGTYFVRVVSEGGIAVRKLVVK